MLLSVQRSKIFTEFTEREQKYWFGIKEKAVAHHIDTLYYNVFIKNDCNDNKYAGMQAFLAELKDLRDKKRLNKDMPYELSEFMVEMGGAGGNIYLYHLTIPEFYDVFVTDYLPNDKTPRIHVQLRTKALIEKGLYGSIEESFGAVKTLLSEYNLQIFYCDINRIDYAFHTNVIQRPSVEFDDEKIARHLDSTFIDGTKHFYLRRNIDQDNRFDMDYLALGNRKSNNIFFRCYEKSKEVIEKNYKGFFLKRWRDRGLISRYDEYVYTVAYQYGTFKTGVLMGRVQWYLEHGEDPELRAELSELIMKCNVESSNNKFIEDKIRGVLPPVTLIMNFEFETKRKYYARQQGFIDFYNYEHKGPAELEDIYKILDMRRFFIHRLTSETVAFREDGADPESPMLDYWKRIHRCRIEGIPDKEEFESYYTYSKSIDASRMRTRWMNATAAYSIMLRGDIDAKALEQDIFEIVSRINDNDLEGNYREINGKDYRFIRKRKGRMLKSMIKKMNKK
ncbi:MAG: hypothetical protein IJY01_03720 [Clostridia bacterium]|nr:hypothetical protein [Clostridia bacterium]